MKFQCHLPYYCNRILLTAAVGLAGFFIGRYLSRSVSNRPRKHRKKKSRKQNNEWPTYVDHKTYDHCVNSLHLSQTVKEIIKYGFPSRVNLRFFQNFVLSYDTRMKIPNWTLEHLNKSKLIRKGASRACIDFQEDLSFPEKFRSANEDYKRSGYDRGHLAAAGNNQINKSALAETFYLSNIAPQIGKGFNRSFWADLEVYARSLTEFFKDVYICTGPLFLPKINNNGKKYITFEVIGENNVAVPTHFFKVILTKVSENKFGVETYIVPNQSISNNISFSHFLVPLREVEKAAGFELFDKIPKSCIKEYFGVEPNCDVCEHGYDKEDNNIENHKNTELGNESGISDDENKASEVDKNGSSVSELDLEIPESGDD